MKTVIATLKSQIAIAKEDIQHEQDYIHQLRERIPQAKIDGDIESLLDTLVDRRETLRIRKQLLGDLRYSLYYAIRALGYNPTEIDCSEPEKFILK